MIFMNLKLPRKSVWVLEDDLDLQSIYSELLTFRFDLKFFDTVSGFAHALTHEPRKPDLLIADLRLKDSTFTKFLETKAPLLQENSIEFFVVSTIDEEETLRKCFDYGAVDYLTKPFRNSELVVKVERFFAIPPISQAAQKSWFQINPVTLNVTLFDKSSPPLTSKEFQMMSLFQGAKDNVLDRNEIITAIWKEVRVSAKTLDVHLFNLRKKLEVADLEINFLPPNRYQLKHLSR